MSAEDAPLNMKQGVYKDYDPLFTADISKKMQMPDRLMAVNGYFDDSGNHFNNKYSMKEAHRLDLPLSEMPFEEPHYILATPPSSITNYLGTTLADDDFDSEMFRRKLFETKEMRNFRSKQEELKDINEKRDSDSEDEGEGINESSVPMTPGTMLLMQDGNSLAALQRHVGKLTHRVAKLQDENRRRRSRELVLYPLVIGYVVFQLGHFLLFKSH